MLDFFEAQATIALSGKPIQYCEYVPLVSARGRVLSRDFIATVDLPIADNSAMDGYAIRYEDFRNDVELPVEQRIFAGSRPEQLQQGAAARIFTGALIPDGADTVVMQEDCVEENNAVKLLCAPKPHSHIRRRGEDIRSGDLLIPAGTLIDSRHIALLASQGATAAVVRARLKVGIMTTGDEVVNVGETRAESKIFNSNAPMLAGLVASIDADVAATVHAKDDPDAISTALRRLVGTCDLIITVGGVSVGEGDLTKGVIESLGGELRAWKVRMKPGKPVALANLAGVPVVCLPGNPVSAFAVYTLLVTPLIRSMQGRTEVLPAVSYLPLRAHISRVPDRDEFLRVRHEVSERESFLIAYDRQGSGMVSSIPWSTGLARVPAGKPVKFDENTAYYDLKYWLS